MFHVKQNKSLKISNKVGVLGENIAVRFLLDKNYSIIERNYLEKTGEIDIICTRDKTFYFVEVKARSVSDLSKVSSKDIGVFEMVTSQKINNMSKTIAIYLTKNKVSHETKWQIMVVGVYIDQINKQSKVVVLDNVC